MTKDVSEPQSEFRCVEYTRAVSVAKNDDWIEGAIVKAFRDDEYAATNHPELVSAIRQAHAVHCAQLSREEAEKRAMRLLLDHEWQGEDGWVSPKLVGRIADELMRVVRPVVVEEEK